MMILSSSYLLRVSPIDLTRSCKSLLKCDPDDILKFNKINIFKFQYFFDMYTITVLYSIPLSYLQQS